MSRIDLGELILALSRVPRALTARSEERRHRKLMRKATRFALGDLPENTFGKIVGVARPANKRLLEAPLSGRLCVYYETHVDALLGASYVRTIATEQEGLAFVVEDGDARVLVDPTNAFMSTGIDFVSTSTFYLPAPREEALLRRHGLFTPVSGKAVRYADGLRYREAIIEADERIAVFGAGVREVDAEAATRIGSSGDGERGYRDAGAPTRMRLSGTSKFPLFISDDPRTL